MRTSSLSQPLRMLFAVGAVLPLISSCTSDQREIHHVEKDSQYWQRVDTTSAVHMQGPKAQYMLNRQIARCRSELRERARLDMLRETIPADNASDGQAPNPESAAGQMAQYDTPARVGPVRTEHHDFVDFTSCRHNHGWERVRYLDDQRAADGRRDYLRAKHGRDFFALDMMEDDSTIRTSSDFEHLND